MLKEVMAPLTGLRRVEVVDLHEPCEAWWISTALCRSSSIISLLLAGSAAVQMPSSLRQLDIIGCGPLISAPACEQLFASLQPLSQLQELCLEFPGVWQLSSGHAGCLLAWHPRLKQLSLVCGPEPIPVSERRADDGKNEHYVMADSARGALGKLHRTPGVQCYQISCRPAEVSTMIKRHLALYEVIDSTGKRWPGTALRFPFEMVHTAALYRQHS